MNCIKFCGLPALLLTALLLLATTTAWPQVEDGDGITLLIKSWRWESDGGRSTIDFSTNTLMLLDGNPVEYALSRDRFVLPGGGGPIAYRYEGLTDRLTLTFPNGVTTEYRRSLGSVMARRHDGVLIDNGGHLLGKFCERSYASDGNPLVRAVLFYDDARFDVSPRPNHAGVPSEDGSSIGTALVWGDRIIMSYDDGVAAEAEVVSRDAYGDVVMFRYLRHLYVRGTCPEQQEPEILVLPPATPETGPLEPSSPPSVAPGAPRARENGEEVKQATRDFGDTRPRHAVGGKSSKRGGRKR